MNVNHPHPPGADAFHRQRSKCVDAFADLEEAVIDVLEVAGTKFGGESFGQKLAKISKAKPSAKLSKSVVAKLPPLIQRCQELAAIRNDIVHSRLKMANIGDDQRACFVNLKQQDAAGQSARLFDLASLRGLTLAVELLARELRALRTSSSEKAQQLLSQ